MGVPCKRSCSLGLWPGRVRLQPPATGSPSDPICPYGNLCPLTRIRFRITHGGWRPKGGPLRARDRTCALPGLMVPVDPDPLPESRPPAGLRVSRPPHLAHLHSAQPSACSPGASSLQTILCWSPQAPCPVTRWPWHVPQPSRPLGAARETRVTFPFFSLRGKWHGCSPGPSPLSPASCV